jgi:hypothetical protein
MLTRRRFLRRSLEAGLVVMLPACKGGAAVTVGAGDILVNHLGFTPGSVGKFCMVAGNAAIPFSIVENGADNAVFQGNLTPLAGDLGSFAVGDFSQFKQPGSYQIRAGNARSGAFDIGDHVYSDAVRKSVSYFAKQRCGNSTTGHHAPCHLDDGRRSDNGKHQDVSGGWHDACDLRKWVEATIHGMTGLSRALDAAGGELDHTAVVDEMRWGNEYFLKMQEPDGYVMAYCGGDDGNRYTDNQIGTDDDRVIHIEAAPLPAQFMFAAAQAAMSRCTRDNDAKYAERCQTAAMRCMDWCINNRSPGAANSLGAGVIAAVQMHRASGDARWKDQAAKYVAKMLSLQVSPDNSDPQTPAGFFLTAEDRQQPLREIQHGNLPMLALCEVLENFADHADAGRWRGALQSHCQYLTTMAARSPFGIVPFGLYDGRDDPGGRRRVGRYWYRWFMKPQNENGDNGDWWVGVNSHLASNGVGLVRAGRLLQDSHLPSLAQRQLDWILGVNPFNASTVTAVGRNQPKLYVTNQFHPQTPQIPGGVMNGIGGTADDQPTLAPGSYNTCEYWTPMVAFTMWLMAELQRSA